MNDELYGVFFADLGHEYPIKGFYIHATIFAFVNIGLFVINALTSGLAGGVWWFYWPLIGWGLGLGAHALGVFGFGGGGPWGRDWEERKTREMMDKEGGLYHASHRIGTSFRAVAPSSHGSQVLR
jgi:hypothetical protein